MDATNARLAARLERLRGYEEDVAAYVRERGDRSGMGRVAEDLREEIERLEEIVEGIRRKIEEGEDGWDGDHQAAGGTSPPAGASGFTPSVEGGRWKRLLTSLEKYQTIF